MERLRNTSTAALLLLVVLLPMRAHAQQADGVSRFSVGDFPGAARAFETALVREPAAAGLWRDLGSARWMQRDDVAAAAAWLRAFALAPRDPALRDAWRQASTIPPDVRGRAPRIPLSRDELILLAASLWLVAMIAGAVRWRRTMWLAASLCAVALGVAGTRWFRERPGRVLVAQSTTMRISPHPATTGLGEIPAWTLVRVQRRIDNWVLVGGQVSTAGSVAGTSVQGWIPLTSVAPIGPLD